MLDAAGKGVYNKGGVGPEKIGANMKLKEIAEKMQEVARGAGRLITEAKHPEVFVKEGHANFVTSMDLSLIHISEPTRH